MPHLNQFLIKSLVTWFGVGLSPFAPGTIGSLAAIPVAAIFHDSLSCEIVVLLSIGLLGLFLVKNYLSESSDPSEVVIDEVFGQLVAIFFTKEMINVICHERIPFYFIVCTSFITFRIFDITKVSLVGVIDRNMKNYIGVMLDDGVAGLFASVTSLVIFKVLCLLKVF